MKIPRLISYEDILRIRIRNNVHAAKKDSATAKVAFIYDIHLEQGREVKHTQDLRTNSRGNLQQEGGEGLKNPKWL